jgi:methionyl-tRNA formyltransferase
MRVVLLTSIAHGLPCRCLPGLAASGKIEVISVILAESELASNAFKTLKKKLKKACRIGFLSALNAIRIGPWFNGGPTEHIEVLCNRLSIPLHRVSALNSAQTAELLKASDADLGLSAGNGYISKRIFLIPRLGMINVHCERLPEYQNAQSVIWPIYNMERTTGLTVHEIDGKIDNGRIIYKEEYPIEFHASLKETVTITTRHTFNKVADAARHVCENYDELIKKAEPQINGKSYATPSFKAFLAMVRNNRKLYESAPGT